MTETELLGRIQVNLKIFSGKPIIRGLRIAVEHILAMLAAGDTPEKILQEYPFLEPKDILACLLFASPVVDRRAGPRAHSVDENAMKFLRE